MDEIRAGKLRHRIGIQQVSEVPDEFGGITRTWSTIATRRASISPLRGRERDQARQVTPELSHKIVMRHFEGLTPKHRIEFDSRTFEINEVMTTDEIKHMQIIMCIERV